MRYPASEKLEIIRIVEKSHLPARRALEQLGTQAFQHDANLLFRSILLAGHSADDFDDLFRWRFPGSGFCLIFAP